MELLLLGLAAYGAYMLWTTKLKGKFRELSKDADYYIEAHTIVMKWSGVNLATAKSFVSDHQQAFYEAHHDGVIAENAVFIITMGVLKGVRVKGADFVKNMQTAMDLAAGVIKYTPDNVISREFGILLDERLSDNVDRGVLSVKAYVFLTTLESRLEVTEEAIESANYLAIACNLNMDTAIILSAQEYIKTRYSGKQLPMIAEARAKGFQG